MKRFIQGEHRGQTTLLPERLDDYVADTNPVRVVDVFVDELDLGRLGFDGIVPAETGRPAYHPAVLLKIYIYGYLNRIQSSRRLEREAQRNIELMWLTGRLAPDFKTIANFRHDNGAGIRNVCRQFVVVCRKLKLFTQGVVAIDGSKFKAVNSEERNVTPGKLRARQAQLEARIDAYMRSLDAADRDEPQEMAVKIPRLKSKLSQIKRQVQELKQLESRLNASAEGQVSLTDPDARAMAMSGHNTGVVGYNVQTAVDAEHHLIVAHEVTNSGSDRRQLANMAKQARAATGMQKLVALADRGYFNGEEVLKCQETGITAFVPKTKTSNSLAAGRFDKQDFIYIAKEDAYRCPAGQRLVKHMTTIEDGRKMHVYWCSVCSSCSLKPQCTTSKQRRVRRWEHEHVMDAMQDRIERDPDKMRVRRQTVEHPFGTIKNWMGATHFLTKTFEHVRTEMSLHVLAYNFKRLLKILGRRQMIEAMRA